MVRREMLYDAGVDEIPVFLSLFLTTMPVGEVCVYDIGNGSPWAYGLIPPLQAWI